MKKFMTILIVSISLNAAYSQKAVFNHNAIYVTDLRKSAAFYKDVIGLDTIPNPFHDDKHVWFDIGSKNQLHIIEGAGSASEHPQANHTCFSVASVDSFIQKLLKAAITFENSSGKKNMITIRPDGVKQIYFKDPDGYWIEINDAKN
jgi:lactoylglutathione lyase